MRFGIGQSVDRVEDDRLLRGRGLYVDDLPAARAARLWVLRAPIAHGRIARVDLAPALALPGVLDAFTVADLDAAGLGPLPCPIQIASRDGSRRADPPRPALARGAVRHVGEPIAAVVAATAAQARDAAEAIGLDLDPDAAVVDAHAALADDAPQLHDAAPGNLCFDWGMGDDAATDAAFADAARIVRLRLINNRLVAHSMETRGCVASYDPGDGRFTLAANTQGGYLLKRLLAGSVFKTDPDRFRIVTPEVGGGFGMKIFLYPEHVLTCFAARRLERPVKWIGERTADAFLSDAQGRDHVTEAALALDADGRALGLRVDTLANLGAQLSTYGPFIPTACGVTMLVGVYAIPAAHVRVRGVFTNTPPTDAYRGAGRPEAIYVIERLMEQAGVETGLGPVEIRRRNMIAPDALPHRTPFAEVYDSGDFAGAMDQALAHADRAGFEVRRAESARRGRLRGFGFASYIEGCGGGGDEQAHIRMTPDGRAEVTIGTQDNGQGHRTGYAQIVAEKLGLPAERIVVRQGDTDLIPYGAGTGGSRSTPVGGAALSDAADRLIIKGERIAAARLEAAASDMLFADGAYSVVGTDKRICLIDVAKASYRAARLPDDAEPRLEATGVFQPTTKTFPNGCHACELEVDPDTGAIAILRYVVVDDFGTLINPKLVAGQVHGGIVQGLGQAFCEHAVFDPDTGQMLSGSPLDYALPRADDMPAIDLHFVSTPCATNPLGVKGCGEAGAIGAPPAAMHALLDALRPAGVTHIDMPATPLAIWRALQAAKAADSVYAGGPQVTDS